MADLEESPIDSLPLLQDSIKRDSGSYRVDFLNQYAALESELTLFTESPNHRLPKELIMFIAHTARFYNKNEAYTDVLVKLLRKIQETAKAPDLKTIVSALCLMDNKGVLNRDMAYELFLEMMTLDHDEIPHILTKQIVNGLVATKDTKDVKKWQTAVFDVFRQAKSMALARRLNFIMISLYLKGPWKDRATVNAISQGLFSSCPKVTENSARFILGDLRRLHISDAAAEEPGDAIEKQAELIASITRELSGKNGKAGKARQKIEKMKELAERNLAKMEEKLDKRSGLTFEIMDQLYDPHSLCEKLYHRINKMSPNSPKKLTFKVKLLCLTVVARLMGKYEVSIPGFFDFISRYTNPHQDQITRVLACLAQAVHRHVPDIELQQCTRQLADRFISESSPPEVVTVGLNTIREMCSRNLEAVTDELLADLVEFQKEGRHPTVRVAASSLRNLFRLKNADRLPRKHRGRRDAEKVLGTDLHDIDEQREMIDGVDILIKLKNVQNKKKRKRGEEVDNQDAENLQKLQSQKVFTSKDFSALKKIRIKLQTARAMGISLSKWLNDENAWHQMADEILGEPDHKKQRTSEDSDNESVLNELDDEQLAVLGLDGGDESEYAPSEPDTEVGSDGDGESDGDGDGESDGDGDGESDSDSVESERETVLTGESLKGRQKISREKSGDLVKEKRKADRLESKNNRRINQHRARAGITNSTSARNKPMAMVRQKRMNKDKLLRSTRDKLASLKSHVKTIKTQIRQKHRRK